MKGIVFNDGNEGLLVVSLLLFAVALVMYLVMKVSQKGPVQ